MTLLVRDEAELVEQWLRYHFARGVDVVIAIDHRSQDGTTELLREEERAGRLHLIRRDDDVIRQADWVTEMARLAATDHGADWVINSDADEFWWPRGGGLGEILEAVPRRYGAVRGLWRNFVLRPDTGELLFAERMTVRCRPSPTFASPYHAQVKVVHRATADVEISRGNHDAAGAGLALIREWIPFEVLHFPLRTRAQFEQKFRHWSSAPSGQHHAEALSQLAAGPHAADAYARSVTFDDDAVAAGLAGERLIEDVRLRNALRELAAGAARLESWVPSTADEVDLIEDVQAMLERDSLFTLARRASGVERAIDRIETLVSARGGAYA
jgi:hypothetical protein